MEGFDLNSGYYHICLYTLIDSQTKTQTRTFPLPMLSVWKACWGRRKQVSTFWPVRSSKSVWNFNIGWAWFSDNQRAFRFRLVTVIGRYSNLKTKSDMNKNFQRKIVNIFLPINVNICFGCWKELTHWEGSFEYPQHMFWLRNKKIKFSLHTLN